MEISSTQKVIQYVLDQIQSKEIKIGDKLKSERELSLLLNVSRSSVREAMCALNIIGMVEVRPQGKSVLKSFQMAGFMNTLSPLYLMEENVEEDLYNYRLCIEKEAVRLACKKKNTSAMKEVIGKMLECNDESEMKELDIQFHLAIFACADNMLLTQSFNGVMTLIQQSVQKNRDLVQQITRDTEILTRQHQAIYQAIKERKESLGMKLMQQHLSIER